MAAAKRRFTVTGRGSFPYDMLRYDSCWPARQEDTAMLERATRRDRPTGTWSLILCAVGSSPTTARWESFGWKVSEVVPL